ncbi:MAG: rhomboid family intramembrane serine protease [Pseudomonadota bacterium]
MSDLLRAPLDADLRPLSALLYQQRILHRVVEEGGEQVVRLAQPADLERAAELMTRWQDGEIELRRTTPSPSATARASSGINLAAYPVTLALIALSMLGFFLVYLSGSVELVGLLTYNPFEWVGGRPAFVEGDGQPWRLITPVFLHFGWTHIVFNSLWCWDLGKRIEGTLGSLNMLGLFLVTAIVSNTAQDWVTGPVLFGGLSGVVYGLLGFAFVAGRLNSRWSPIAPAVPVMLFMVGWLVFCMSGLVDVLGFSVANTAHLSGLLCGAAMGAVFALRYRSSA